MSISLKNCFETPPSAITIPGNPTSVISYPSQARKPKLRTLVLAILELLREQHSSSVVSEYTLEHEGATALVLSAVHAGHVSAHRHYWLICWVNLIAHFVAFLCLTASGSCPLLIHQDTGPTPLVRQVICPSICQSARLNIRRKLGDLLDSRFPENLSLVLHPECGLNGCKFLFGRVHA
ncbi:hypothetical protein G7048_19245 [Diaphorobacter sp. HDW4B]|uniref:hypothetical protein n=1 Tax=Diaphorobacter sp. HDW4B TaxID=2714925 RepID=UPI00140D4ECF|nr:hypothetical protein [Diaphorobacter sp. HDW4B]QIL72302.1 hypothetical protein G7048_19245 [Diaphorobacter sp. HDW4B]